MSCGPTNCPPLHVPDPRPRPTWPPGMSEGRPTWSAPDPSDCRQRGTTVYYNTAQIFTDTCFSGSPTPAITVTVPSHTFSSTISQADANAQALASAEAQAEALRILSPCVSPDAGSHILFNTSDIFITGGGDSIII